jgi:hypothetical protein
MRYKQIFKQNSLFTRRLNNLIRCIFFSIRGWRKNFQEAGFGLRPTLKFQRWQINANHSAFTELNRPFRGKYLSAGML